MADASDKPTLNERAFERLDLRVELDRIEEALNHLKMTYEQYFSGLLPFAPEKEHAELKASIRRLRKAPFKSSALNFRLRTLESRFQTFNSYWQRILREREEGTYSRDVFKANLHEREAREAAHQRTKEGKASAQMKELFHAYKDALERQTGKAHNLDFKLFHENLVHSARELKKQVPGKKVTFSVVVQDGKVKLKARCS